MPTDEFDVRLLIVAVRGRAPVPQPYPANVTRIQQQTASLAQVFPSRCP